MPTHNLRKVIPSTTQQYDLIIIGGGPAGLTAAINASTEGLKTLILEKNPDVGGGARDSWYIENYPGFPQGITGKKLFNSMADQAAKFGTHIQTNSSVRKIFRSGNKNVVVCNSGARYMAPCVMIATGVQNVKLPQLKDFENKGAITGMPVELLKRKAGQFHLQSGGHVVVVGGGNSAAQAAQHLSELKGVHATLVVRSNMKKSMSRVWVDRIHKNPNIRVLEGTEIVEPIGDKKLTGLKLSNGETIPTNWVFTYVGNKTGTDWLDNTPIKRDEKGFIKTGEGQSPYETSMPGVFAAGDIRSGEERVPRVTGAVGEGIGVLQQVHKFISKHPDIAGYHHSTLGRLKRNPCRYPWQKDSLGKMCGQRASLTPKFKKFPKNIYIHSPLHSL